MARPSKKATIILISAATIIALGATAAIAGPVFYRDVIAGPAYDAPTAELDARAPSTLDEDTLAGDWTVADGSYAGYRVDEVLNGVDVTVTGRTEDVTGTVTTSDTAVTAATITVDVASIATDSSQRDAYFRDSALRVSEHPTATFELTSPIEAPSGADVDAESTVTASGVLTLAGVSQDVTVDVTAAADGNTIRIAGQIPVTFADFGVQAPSLGFVKVEDSGLVEFLVVLEQGPRG